MAIIDPTAVDVRPRGRTKRRLLQMLIAATAVFGAIGLTAGPASAAQTCTGATDSNLCLTIDRRADGNFDVHVGIDVYMSLEEAQEYIDDPGDPFIVWIRGDDGDGPAEFLFTVPLTALEANSDDGVDRLAADFHRVVSGSALNEDSPKYGPDEVRAVVNLIDTDTNTFNATFVSNQIVGNWP